MTSQSSSQCYLLPELWLEIFDHLPCQNICDLTLTCHFFRQLAQPLLFRSLTLRPFHANHRDNPVLAKNGNADRALVRLEFCSSDRISYAVRTCKILPQPKRCTCPRNRDGYNIILDSILSLLPRLVNLRELSLLFLEFSGVQLKQLCWLKQLDSLSFTNCTVTTEVPPSSPLKVSTVEVFRKGQLVPFLPVSQYQLDISILQPHHLKCLSFNEYHSAAKFLRSVVSNNTELSLLNLRVPISLKLLPILLQFLMNCPALQELGLLQSRANTYPDVGNFLTPSSPRVAKSLSGYHGPYSLLPCFVEGQALRRLSLWDGQRSRESAVESDSMRNALSRSATLIRQVETLEVNVICINENVVTLFRLFPNLHSLYVRTRYPLLHSSRGSDAYSLETLLEALLEFEWPPALRKFCLCCQLGRPPRLPNEDEGRYLDLKQRLQDKYSDLHFQRVANYEVTITRGCEYAVPTSTWCYEGSDMFSR